MYLAIVVFAVITQGISIESRGKSSTEVLDTPPPQPITIAHRHSPAYTPTQRVPREVNNDLSRNEWDIDLPVIYQEMSVPCGGCGSLTRKVLEKCIKLKGFFGYKLELSN